MQALYSGYRGQSVADDETCEVCGESLPCSCWDDAADYDDEDEDD